MTQSETAGRLLKNRSRIIDLWEKRTYQEVAAARGMKSLALRNSLEDFLKRLAETLGDGRKTQSRQAQRSQERGALIVKHGKLRAGEVGYVLHEVIFEFHILRQVLFEILEEESPLAPTERDAILNGIEQAVNDAASGFSDTLRDVQEHFALALTHDLRGPLTASKAAAQIILRRPDHPDLVEKSAFHIVESMDRMDQMIRDLLNAGSLRAGQSLPLEFSEFDLDALVAEVADEFRMTDPERFTVRTPHGISGRWSYEGLRRVIQNLMMNAVKYGAPGSPVTVTLEEIGQTVRLVVHNTGSPIPRDKQASLFEPFRRIDATPEKTGWGLGLFLAKGLVEAHNGTIRVESSADAGTRFVVELPHSTRALKTG